MDTFGRFITYKGIDFKVVIDNQDVFIRAVDYPISVNGVYLLDKPIMDSVYKILDEIEVVSMAERYEEFIGTP